MGGEEEGALQSDTLQETVAVCLSLALACPMWIGCESLAESPSAPSLSFSQREAENMLAEQTNKPC